MLVVHPTLQTLFLGLAMVNLILGVQRFRSLHLHHRVRFRRAFHVRLGSVVVAGILAGAVVGGLMTRHAWGRSFMTLGHGVGGAVTAAVFVLGAATGWALHRHPGKRVLLPAVHGLANTLGVFLALNQVRTGIAVYRTFVMGL